MRCRACNVALSDFEATRKSVKSGEFVDLCDRCFGYVKAFMEVEEREDLKRYEEITPLEDNYDDNDV